MTSPSFLPGSMREFISLGIRSSSARATRRLAIRVATFIFFLPTIHPLIAAFCCLAKVASPLMCIRKLVGAVGIEPTTFGLKGRCSTTELRP